MADGQMNIRATLDISELERNAARYRSNVTQMGVVTDEQGRIMSTAWTRMKQAASAYLTLDIIKQIAETRGEFQSLNVAFTTMLGDGAKAQMLMAESVELAAKTPFSLQDVATGAKQLLAYGFAADGITGTLRRLGDVASALGLPMERLTYLYGTTATQGRLFARDMIQFTTSGVPVLQELANMYGKTTEEINTMVTAGKIGFDDVRKVFENMTNEGGRFYNLMEETSKTITGKISNLGDAIEVMFNDIGQANEGIITGAIDGAKYLVENYEKVLDILKVLVVTYGTYKASLIAVAAAQRLSVTIQNISAWLSLAKTIKTAKDAQIAFNLATKANPYVLLATVIIGVGTALYQFTKKTDSAKESLKQFNDEADRQTEKYRNLITTAQDESKATYERQQALDELRKLYPAIFANMDLEALKTADQTKLTNDLTKAERERQKAQSEANISSYEKSIEAIRKEVEFLQKTPVANRAERLSQTNKKLEELQDKLRGEQTIYKQITSEIKTQEAAEKRATEEAEKRANAIKKTVKWYDEEIKSTKEAQEKSTTSSEYQKYQKQIDNLKKQRAKIVGKEDKDLQKQSKLEQDINQAIIENDLKLQQERLSVLEDGRTKQLALIDLETKEKIAAIDKEQQELAQKYKESGRGNLPVEITQKFDARKQSVADESAKKRFDIEYKYNLDTEKLYEQLADVFLIEEERKTKAVQERYDELRKANLEEYNNEIAAISATKKGIGRDAAIKESESKYNKTASFIDAAQAQEELQTLLDQYKSYSESRKKIEEKFTKDYENLEKRRTDLNATEINQAQEELNYQKTEALNQIDQQFASRSDEFQAWMDQIANMSIEHLNSVLKDAQAKLAELEKKGGGTGLATARAKVTAVQKEISSKQAKTTPEKRSIKEWEDLYKTLLKVDDQFREIGDSVGGLAGEMISSAGEIASSTLSMINGITTLANWSITATEMTAKGVATSIQMVEKASVILTIISAALQIATKIASLFVGKSKAELDTERLQKTTDKIKETNEIINSLIEKRIELIKKANAEERAGIKESTLDSIEIQKKRIEVEFNKLLGNRLLGKKGKNNDLTVEAAGVRTIEQLKEFLSSQKLLDLEAIGYGLDNKDMWNDIIKSWDELNEKALELESIVKEANTGLTFDEAKDGLDDLLLSADTTFEDISDNFEGYMRNSILNMVKSKYLNNAMQKWYDNFSYKLDDGVLSEQDVNRLRDEYEEIYNNASDRINSLLNAAGVSLEGESGKERTQAGVISETLKEETASEMMGIWRGQYDVIKNIQQTTLAFYDSYKSTIAISNEHLRQIVTNTESISNNTAVLSDMNSTISRMDSRLKTIETKTTQKYI